MAIFRGVGGSGESSDNSFLQEVTAQAQAAEASATSAANSLAAIQDTEITSASFDTGDGVLTLTKTGGATVTADLDGRFLTSYTETNDLSTAVTWANVPDANITQTSVTQHQAALTITESQISDLQSYLTSYTETNDLSTTVTWADVPDSNITETSVTQHQTALSITESQISDLQTYLTTHQDISGKANLAGASFTGSVGIGSLGSPQTLDVYGSVDLYSGANVVGDITATNDVSISGTVNTNNIESTIDSVDYPVYSTSLDGSNAIATLGGTASGDKVHTLEMRPAAGGVRMHWHQTTDNIAGQTLRFHTTDRGVHVGDDLVGTYTAGDNQSNADTDFGMLVGRESSNLGSNNFGFGYNIGFSVGTASNLGVGSIIRVLGQAVNGTTNSVAFGGNLRLGRYTAGGEVGATSSLVGGELARTGGAYSFTWGKGELDQYGQYPTNNEGTGCVLFGHITEIDPYSQWSMAGGDLDGSKKTKLTYANSCIGWGKGVRITNSAGSVVFGVDNSAYFSSKSVTGGEDNFNYAPWTVLGGYSNAVGYSTSGNNSGKYSACFGANNLVEGDANFVSGQSNNTLGDSGACIGRGLKTPLFQPVGGGDYVWDDYSITVGAYNDEAHKYYTNTSNNAWVTDHRFVVGTGTSTSAKDNGFIVAVPDSGFCGIIMPALASSTSYTNATAAKQGGVPVGGLYRIGSDVKILLSTD